jgi:hypothetical protein
LLSHQPLLFFLRLSLTRWPCTISGRQIDENAHKSKTIVIITSHNRYTEIVFPSGFALKMGSLFSDLMTHQNDAPLWCIFA